MSYSLLSPDEEPAFNSGVVRPFQWAARLLRSGLSDHGTNFPFAYQLVVDRKMTGWKAVKLSARAARANFDGVLGLVIVDMVLVAFGFALCCVGLSFVMPWSKSAWAIAYTEVFSRAPQNQPPPPPPAFGG